MNRLKQRVERIEQREQPEFTPVIVLSIPVECRPLPFDGSEWFLSKCGKFMVTQIVFAR